MKTVKQISEEIGKSKQSVMNKIKELNLQSDLQRVGNKFVIDEITEKKIKQGFDKKTQNNFVNENANYLAILEKQLDEKDKQIEKLQTMLSQEQALHLQTQTQLQETKVLLEEPKKHWWQK